MSSRGKRGKRALHEDEGDADGEAMTSKKAKPPPKKGKGKGKAPASDGGRAGDEAGPEHPGGPADNDDPEIWNERSPTRSEILGRLKAALLEKHGWNTVTPAFWAFCQLAELTKLESLIRITNDDNSELAKLVLEATIDDCPILISRCRFLIPS
jgi:hypothetical protein